MSEKKIIQKLMMARTVKDVEGVLEEFSALFRWEKLGGRENCGAVEMGSDPGDAILEAGINGIDAVLERRYKELGSPTQMPRSPAEAADAWFPGHRNDPRGMAERVKITLVESGVDEAADPEQWQSVQRKPTVVIEDRGIGQPPSQFSSTFLAIEAESKQKKPFLMGAYCMGFKFGIGFAGYTIIISRRPNSCLNPGESAEVGVTVVRRRDRDDYRTPIYEYLVLANGQIPAVAPGLMSDPSYEGTMIRFVQLEIPKLSNLYRVPTKSLLFTANAALWTPPFPILIRDERSARFESITTADATTGRVVTGNRSRLSSGDESSCVEHTGDWSIDLGPAGKVKARYWVTKKREQIESYVERSVPAIVTLEGKRQIGIARAELKIEGLDFIRDSMIIEIDGNDLTPRGRRIFASTRSHARQNEDYDALVGEVRACIKEDEDLKQLNQARKDKVLTESATEEEEKAREILQKLLEAEKVVPEMKKIMSDDWTLPVVRKDPKPRTTTTTPGATPPAPPPAPPAPPPPVLHAVPTQLVIRNVGQPIELEKGRGVGIFLALDAKDDYLDPAGGGTLIVSFQPEGKLMVKAQSKLKAGRMVIRIGHDDNIRVGTKVDMKIEVTRPGMGSLTATRQIEVIKAAQRLRAKVGGRRELEGAPELKLVGREKWEELGWDATTVGELKDKTIFVNRECEELDRALRGVRAGQELLERYRTKYAAHVALVIVLAARDPQKDSLPEGYQQRELRRAARAVARAVILAPQAAAALVG